MLLSAHSRPGVLPRHHARASSASTCPPARCAASATTRPASTGDYWARGAELGWTSLLVDEAHGGGSISDAGLVDLTLVADAFGRRAAPGPLIPTNVVAATLSDVDGDAWSAVLAALLTGAVGRHLVRSPSPPRRGASATSRSRCGSTAPTWCCDGVKRPVESADQADHLLVTGRTGDGLTQVLVPARRAGRVDHADAHARPHPPLLRRVLRRGPAAGRRRSSARSARPARRSSASCSSPIVLANAESVGAMQAGFDMTVEWAFDRYSFGRPLASYQALKHRFADMLSLARGQPRHQRRGGRAPSPPARPTPASW